MKRFFQFSAAIALLAACEGSGQQDLTVDVGLDRKSLQTLRAGIWVDPNGCEHWIVDDGIEGYLSQRLHPSGKPVCGNTAPAGTIINNHKRGSEVADVF